MNDTWKLIERDDEGKATERVVCPIIKFALPRCRQRICELRSDLSILLGTLAPPKRGLRLVHGKVVLCGANPELVDLKWSTYGHDRRLADKVWRARPVLAQVREAK